MANRHSLSEFIEKTKNQDRGQGLFELESDRLLELNLNGEIWTKFGSMVAYRGNVKFQRQGLRDQGLGNLIKKAVTNEGTKLSKATGNGVVYLADQGKKITILKLEGDSIVVNGNDILAFETSIENKIMMMKKLSAAMAGGLFKRKRTSGYNHAL